MKAFQYASWILLLLGLVLLTAGLWIGISNISFLKNSDSAQGEVVRLEVRSSHASDFYYPIVRFTTKTGQVVEFEHSIGSKPASYVVGERVLVYYDKSHPERAKIGNFGGVWGMPAMLVLGGLVFGFIGSVLIYQERKRH